MWLVRVIGDGWYWGAMSVLGKQIQDETLAFSGVFTFFTKLGSHQRNCGKVTLSEAPIHTFPKQFLKTSPSAIKPV